VIIFQLKRARQVVRRKKENKSKMKKGKNIFQKKIPEKNNIPKVHNKAINH
jgi:hypothetical protein